MEVRKTADAKEILHFTEAPDIQHFAEVKVSENDNVYGIVWGNVVREYLKTAYSGEDKQAEIISDGITYRVLKREEVTAFYDADGNTLFDVENKRLDKEYGYVMKDGGAAPARCITGKSKSGICGAAAYCAKGLECCSACSNPCNSRCGCLDVQEEFSADKTPNVAEKTEEDFKGKSCEKLRGELEKADDKQFADPVIRYLIKRCGEDAGLAQDVMQEHKSWKKCYGYIFEQAQKQAKKERSIAVRSDVVFEWAEDYYHKDNQAEEEKKAREAAGRRKKEEERKRKAAEQHAAEKKKPKQAAKKEEKEKEKPAEPQEPKKNRKEIDGQMDLFSMMDM